MTSMTAGIDLVGASPTDLAEPRRLSTAVAPHVLAAGLTACAVLYLVAAYWVLTATGLL